MIIYKIENLIDGKIYIGQTVFSFNERYRNGKWWHYTSNIHLKRAAKKYGIENFSVEILENDISTLEELDKLEVEYIKSYNCMGPNGYNMNSGGSNRHFYTKEQRRKTAAAIRGTEFVELKNQLTGEVRKIYNVAEFAKENNMSDGQLCDVLKGNIMSCKFWTLPNLTMRYWILENRDGRKEKVIENNGRDFCRRNNISERQLQDIKMGREIDGWIVTFFQKRIGWNGTKQKPRTHPPIKYASIYKKFNTTYLCGVYTKEVIAVHGDIRRVIISNILEKLKLNLTRTSISSFLNGQLKLLDNKFYLSDKDGNPVYINLKKYNKGKFANLIAES